MTCTEAGRPNVSDYVLKNLASLCSNMRKQRHLMKEGGKRAKNGQISKPDFSLMGDRQKKAFSEALVTNSDYAKEFKQYVKKAKLSKEEDKSDDDTNINRFPIIAVLNDDIGASPSFLVKLEGNLAHIKLLVGRKNTKGTPLTALWSLIDSGAGATNGLLDYF